jgi:hypothetical protein
MRDALSGRALPAPPTLVRFEGDAVDDEAIAASSALLCGSRDCSAERAAACSTSASIRFESSAATPWLRPVTLVEEEDDDDIFDDAMLAEPAAALVVLGVADCGCGETSC